MSKAQMTEVLLATTTTCFSNYKIGSMSTPELFLTLYNLHPCPYQSLVVKAQATHDVQLH